MDKILVICGPTATGKTALGIRLAKEFNGEIISADSRQVYRGMDIGTGKDIGAGIWRTARRRKEEEPQGYWEVEGVPIHLLDVVDPNQEFSVGHYYDLAWEKTRGLWQREKLPLLVGGTGFYIKAVVDGIETLKIPPNPRIRKDLENKNPSQLLVELEKIDPFKVTRMNVSDRKNPRRLIRAIEIACWRIENQAWAPPEHQSPETFFIGLKAPLKTLYERIDRRVEKRLEMGVQQEIETLLKKGYNWQNSALAVTIGYREWRPFFDGQATKEEVIRRWQFAEHNYSRRQMTWFKKDKRINWFDISQKGWQDDVEKFAKNWYYQSNAQEN